MKNIKQIISVMALGTVLISVVSCKNETKKAVPQQEEEVEVVHSNPEFKDANVEKTFQHYLSLKDALVKTDAKEAKKDAELMASTATNEDLKKLAVKISEENDIKIQREQFSELTTLLKPVLKGSLVSGEIYEQHCPMALKGGANWFAVEKQINNPYYGDKMLHCGLVQETLK
ncbi:DUF3347 domain-containing protein [Formosa sp. 3Alg 14/1]|uniref:DUF3347 domain-containing protein n=1 Tax=Formosa sp. 3Alg 14/1 TaxID=3382190 RepID=UPI0039BE0CB5